MTDGLSKARIRLSDDVFSAGRVVRGCWNRFSTMVRGGTVLIEGRSGFATVQYLKVEGHVWFCQR